MATRIMFLYNNLVDSASAITASSAATGYPVTNLKNKLRSKVWTTAGATAGTANVVFDFGTAQAATAIAVTGYTWTSAPGTLNVEFNAADAWGAPSVTKTLTWYATPTANGNKATIILTFASISYRYARLNVVYSPGAVPTDWSLGRIFIGPYFQPDKGYNRRHEVTMIDPSLSQTTVGGQRYVDEIEKYREVDFGFMATTQAQWELFQTMVNTTGISQEFFIAFDYDSEPDEMTIYGHFTRLPRMARERIYTFDMSFREAR